MSRKKSIISKANPHTIKKFELIEKYIKSWAQKLMLQESCSGLIYIDCMCNSGIYQSNTGELVEGSPVRVAKVLLDVARTYTEKVVHLYFNDKDKARIDELQKHLPQEERNYRIVPSSQDANKLLTTIGPQLSQNERLHYFLLYDPYDASINWKALLPFFRHWGEVMINHMVIDPVRAITSAKRQVTKDKYANTYLQDFEELVPYGSDKQAYEKRVEQIIQSLKGNRRYYVAAFPFYNSQNSLLYNLIHCTSNLAGFRLYKQCAWKTFGAQSSTKHSPVTGQLCFDDNGFVSPVTDPSCLQVSDIAKYLQNTFRGRQQVSLTELWKQLDDHPIFPSDGFRNEIKTELKNTYKARLTKIYREGTRKFEAIVNFENVNWQ